MGSDSDLPVMQEAVQVLDQFQVTYDLQIVSAHRTPEKMFEYARTAAERQLKVIIAGAGGSAHLPGMVAAITPLPVIGVPIQSKTLSGIDSLYSIVQMPPGVPVATVAINGAKNAGLLALQILGTTDTALHQKILEYKQQLRAEVETKNQTLSHDGYQLYLKHQGK